MIRGCPHRRKRRVVDGGRIVGDAHAVSVRGLDTSKRVLEDRIGRIDELLHALSLWNRLVGGA